MRIIGLFPCVARYTLFSFCEAKNAMLVFLDGLEPHICDGAIPLQLN